MGSALGVRKGTAARLGMTLEDYDARHAAGEKWCTGCQSWHPRAAFAADATRPTGLTASCTEYRNSRARAEYVPIPRPAPGRRYVEARDGDQRQARRRVNNLVAQGLIPRPNDLPCTDCGHVYAAGERRHEYDHYAGYAAEHHEDVQPVCTTCHHAREVARKVAA